ncbi:TPA: hypothetical protein HIQ84_001866 [Escherichia coli]|nr:hypothetical protein [Escherichia coli]HAH8847005.1 hypothetical protein [Escherichia coli]
MSPLPTPVKVALLTNPLFSEVLERCLQEEELIEQFERLSGVKRPASPKTGIEALVDKATGYTDEQWETFFSEFIPFVHDCVWLTWEGRFQEYTA